jgi:hypothetical protein
MLVQIQQQKEKQILKDATEKQCFGQFMKISEIAESDEDQKTTSTAKSMVNVYVNGLPTGIGDESSMTLGVYEYVADDEMKLVYNTI